MYAIITIGGHQHKISPNQDLVVDKLEGKVGTKLLFSPLMVADGKKIKLGKAAESIKIEATIKSFGKGEKVTVSKFRAKSRYRRRTGFRPAITTLHIEEFGEKVAASPISKRAPATPRKTTRQTIKKTALK